MQLSDPYTIGIPGIEADAFTGKWSAVKYRNLSITRV